jgi:hypothetical protein
LTIEEARAKYPNEKFTVIHWDDIDQYNFDASCTKVRGSKKIDAYTL